MSKRPFDLIVFDWEGTLAPSPVDSFVPILFPGVHAMLVDLVAAGYKLAVATGKTRAGLNEAIAALSLASFFSDTRCAEESYQKPHPAMLYELADALDVALARTVMVGDTVSDMGMAINAGACAVAVGYGLQNRALLEAYQPLYCALDVAQLHAWFLAAESVS
ncbi:MAG: HAD-IIIA family hydrolase [Ottowia sp.]|nr:HAD-IIIA family hydrolase [Ottowia sp.]